jgi:hypothetical protein
MPKASQRHQAFAIVFDNFFCLLLKLPLARSSAYSHIVNSIGVSMSVGRNSIYEATFGVTLSAASLTSPHCQFVHPLLPLHLAN